ncbi:hypothetical protein [Yoonia litorea]|uniref:Predicted O-methyltransferase YrrM n=1 Tax=Yoonia litorea TaxID=1123755 RepID=A0A1I6N2N8_9RHOB|nr:hypothetical protein [Yoonia litorea]SFS22242.1 Predicted O-methyltransferase YrrM [Yoonia litorea]
MPVFEEIENLTDIPRKLRASEAALLRQKLIGEAPESVLEVCQDISQLTLYLAAILDDRGGGSLTTFHSVKQNTRATTAIRELGLQERIASIPSGRSYTWAMQRLLSAQPPLSFDVCVLNGHKTWDASGFGIVLADLLLRPGGLMVFLDTQWSMSTSPYFRERPHLTQKFDADELASKPVALAIERILPRLNYDVSEVPEVPSMSFARKK